jgi:hypothetical protein
MSQLAIVEVIPFAGYDSKEVVAIAALLSLARFRAGSRIGRVSGRIETLASEAIQNTGR